MSTPRVSRGATEGSGSEDEGAGSGDERGSVRYVMSDCCCYREGYQASRVLFSNLHLI